MSQINRNVAFGTVDIAYRLSALVAPVESVPRTVLGVAAATLPQSNEIDDRPAISTGHRRDQGFLQLQADPNYPEREDYVGQKQIAENVLFRGTEHEHEHNRTDYEIAPLDRESLQ